MKILVCENPLCRTAHWINDDDVLTKIVRCADLSPEESLLRETLLTKFCLGGSKVIIIRCTNDACDHVTVGGLPKKTRHLPFKIGFTIEGKEVNRRICPECRERLSKPAKEGVHT